jgi:hypothetical protein
LPMLPISPNQCRLLLLRGGPVAEEFAVELSIPAQ